MIGTTITHYKILAKLGAGGMGEVFRATDTELGRDVAVKVLPAEAANSAEARSQLKNEARNASALNHPHICHIYEVSEAGGVMFFAMELVEGEPLARRIPSAGLPTETVARYGGQIAAALAHAHERGILHRDLKSANVMITREGAVKVLDFGLAQRLRAEDLAGATRSKVTVQQSGAIAGTLPYLAPEVLRGEPASEQSDIWALGVLLQEMASGNLPFAGRTGYELTAAILREPPRPMEKASPGVRAVVQRCLAKEPSQRYQKAAEVRAALEAIGSTSQVAVQPASASSGRWIWPAIAVSAILVAVLLITRPWKNAPPSPDAGATRPAGRGPIVSPLGAFMIKTPSANPEANELLQRAMMHTRYQLDPIRARQMLERALQLDPGFSEARINYALTYLVAVEMGISNDSGDIFRAEEELRRTLKDDPDLPRAHALMGAVHFFQGRVDLAEEEESRAVRLAPGDLGGRMWLLINWRFRGRGDDAIGIAHEVIQSEPLFWPPRHHLGELLREQSKTADSVREQQKVLEQDSQNVGALRGLMRTYADVGDLPMARKTLDRLRPEDRENYRVRIAKAQLYALEGKTALALKEMDEQVLKYADLQPFSTLDAAEVYALLGEKEKAIEWMDRSMRKGDDRVEWMRRDPLLTAIREHPRFKQILNSMEYRRQQGAVGSKR